MTFTDLRYRLVDLIDAAFHKVTPDYWEWPLCNVERRMYEKRLQKAIDSDNRQSQSH